MISEIVVQSAPFRRINPDQLAHELGGASLRIRGPLPDGTHAVIARTPLPEHTVQHIVDSHRAEPLFRPSQRKDRRVLRGLLKAHRRTHVYDA